jgi:hypothetical protein
MREAKAELTELLDRVCRIGATQDSLNRVAYRHPEWTPEQLKRNIALTAYTHNCFRPINAGLRGGGDARKDDLQAVVALILGALETLPVHRGRAYRGVDLPLDALERYQVGAVVEEAAFCERERAFRFRFQGPLRESRDPLQVGAPDLLGRFQRLRARGALRTRHAFPRARPDPYLARQMPPNFGQ